MKDVIDTQKNQDGSYSVKHNSKNVTIYKQPELDCLEKNPQGAVRVLEDGYYINDALTVMSKNLIQNTNQLNHQIRYFENTNQRYWNVENTRQWILLNENAKYNELMQKQSILFNLINYLEIRFWRYKEKLYFRTTKGQLIIDNNIEIQKELSSRYGADVFIVNDMNDALKNNNQYRTNTIFIAINNITVVEEEVFDNNHLFEIFNTYNGSWKRNLLAYTRFNKKRIPR